ncbi:MAG: hypothetical protein PWQ06_1057 [Anaerophaga sp.]|nr:hypothetical protein [Anaerophaga sp.]
MVAIWHQTIKRSTKVIKALNIITNLNRALKKTNIETQNFIILGDNLLLLVSLSFNYQSFVKVYQNIVIRKTMLWKTRNYC